MGYDEILRIDYANVMSDGSTLPDAEQNLVSEHELDSLAGRVLAGHKNLEKMGASGEIGFIDLPDADISETLALVERYRPECDAVVVLGIGGSALGTIAVATALLHPWHNLLSTEQRAGAPRLFVLDNIDPTEMAALFDMLDPARTVFNVISKSGETAETMSQFLMAADWLKKSLGDRWTDRVVMTTGPAAGSSSQKLVRELGLAWLPVPENVGGRFSVLTPVGLFPLAMVGVDVKSTLDERLQCARNVSFRICGPTQRIRWQRSCICSIQQKANIRLCSCRTAKPYGTWPTGSASSGPKVSGKRTGMDRELARHLSKPAA